LRGRDFERRSLEKRVRGRSSKVWNLKKIYELSDVKLDKL
jgi:hypothetical protein